MPAEVFGQVTVIAPGLLGGSLALACRERGLARTVLGVARRQETLDLGLRKGAFDRVSLNIREGVEEADLVVIAAPVRASMQIMGEMAPLLREGCLVTDMGSTKGAVMQEAQRLFGVGRFVGGHPMAGSHHTGILAARADLFEGAHYLLTADGSTAHALMEGMETLARGLGATPLWLDAGDHDRLVARISHVPHLAACALVECARGYVLSGIEAMALASSGFRDTTRIAAGDASMWTDICLTNEDALLEGLDTYIAALAHLRSRISRSPISSGVGDELHEWFTVTGDTRRCLSWPARPEQKEIP